MTNSEKIVTWGLLGLIAWELYQRAGVGGAAAPGQACPDLAPTYAGSTQSTPTWVQQLSGEVYGSTAYVAPPSPFCGSCL